VQKLMHELGLAGVPTRKHHKNLGNLTTFEDLVQRASSSGMPPTHSG